MTINLPLVYRLLKGIQQDLEFKYTETSDNNNQIQYILMNITSLNGAYNTVTNVAPFLIDNFIRNTFTQYKDIRDYHSIRKSAGENLKTAVSYLKEYVDGYIDYLQPYVFNETDEDSFDVKFTHITDLDELEKTISQLKRAIATPVYELDGKAEIQRVDSGSIVMTILIIGAATQILKTIANMIWAAVAIRNKEREGIAFLEQTRTVTLKNDVLEHLSEQLNN